MKDFLPGVAIFLIDFVAWFCGGGDDPRIPLVFRCRNLGWSGHLVLRGVAMAMSSGARLVARTARHVVLLHSTGYLRQNGGS